MDLWPIRRLPMGARLAALWVVGAQAMAIGVHGAGVLMREGLMAIALIGEARLDQLRKARASF
jgi:hypothetical protein